MQVPETTMGRPKKYGDEESISLSIRLPGSALVYLGRDRTHQREGAIACVFFERELTAALADSLAELRISAAQHGKSYELDRAQTLARLIKAGLKAEKGGRR